MATRRRFSRCLRIFYATGIMVEVHQWLCIWMLCCWNTEALEHDIRSCWNSYQRQRQYNLELHRMMNGDELYKKNQFLGEVFFSPWRRLIRNWISSLRAEVGAGHNIREI
ncbi:hypothetical protein R3P38DRAFT_467201 [Favolaschia claudopus]|uniref:Secreted protein n=1 Tax=Favolaschia claudopus TaxID=2862362 RepID=A0AAV9ZEM7_9AGAR